MMNKYEGMVEYFKHHLLSVELSNRYQCPFSFRANKEKVDEVKFYMQQIEELVEKSKPKPLVEKWAFHCPNCDLGMVIDGESHNYCSNCGQKLREVNNDQ